VPAVRLVLLACVLAAVGLTAPAASAAQRTEIGIADDAILLADQDRAPAIVQQWRNAGIETVRIQVRWAALVRDPLAPTAPLGFDATDPEDPGYDWGYLDRAIAIVVDAGLKPILSVTGSGPLWATQDPSLGNVRYQPDPARFGAFATAVARRYGAVVDRYIVWNEPNEPLWLQPQQECPPKRGATCTPVAPHTYRALVRAAYPAIHAADPQAEVWAGALAPRGDRPIQRNRPLRPLAFLRAFGCVDVRLRPVRTGRCRDFAPARIDGLAYHPHPVKASPSTPSPQPDDAAIADMPELERTLDAIQRAHGFTTPAGAPVALHLTEFGYQTNPPDGGDGVPVGRAARWLQEAAYRVWRDPRVKTLVQYAWEDEPVRNLGPGRARWSGWQSGLLNSIGRPKATLGAFEHPFYADVEAVAPRVRFWGQVRPGGEHAILLQKAGPSGAFTTVRRLRTDAYGTFATTLAVAGRGRFRYRTADPPGTPVWVSDAVTVTPRRPARHATTAASSGRPTTSP